MNMRRKQRGGTLIEMVIAIVVISIAMVGILSGINAATSASVDPVFQVKGVALAKSVIEDLHAEPFERIQSLSWDQLKIMRAGSSLIQIAEEAKFEISIEIHPEALPGVPEQDCKRVDVRVRHLAFKTDEGLVLTTYMTRMHDALPPIMPAPPGGG